MSRQGRIAKNLWTPEGAKNAAAEGTYIVVGERRGTRKITTALRQWKKDENAHDHYLPLPYQSSGH